MTDVNDQLNTEMRNKKSECLHQFSTLEIIKLMNEEDHEVPVVVKRALPQIEKVIDQAVKVLNNGGKLFYFGAGTSGRLGVLDASECPPTFGVSEDLINGIIAGGDHALRYAIEGAEDSEEAGAGDVKKYVNGNDMVIGIASSGKTPYVLGAMKAAEKASVPTGCIVCNDHSPLSQLVTFPVELPVGAEVITGSTRLKAGTAQKMVLNMISSAAMIKLGKVYKNLMVNVKASNAKLRQRTISIIQEVTGAGEAEAVLYSERAKGDARVAILMYLLKTEAEQAKKLLDEKDGNFAEVMKSMENK
jgi:N-acetylmuramic acid 6-phosphate etherase